MSDYFGTVDTGYLHTVANFSQQTKQRTYDLMHIQPGHNMLDVGCGPGIDTVSLAVLVGANGSVVGVDLDESMVAYANQRAVQAGVSEWVTHQQASALSLPFQSNTYNSCRSERLLQHLQDPFSAVREMVRVTRPKGWIVIADVDWGTLSVDSSETDVQRRLVRVEVEAHHNGYSGRQLYRFFKRLKLTDVTIEMFHLHFTDLSTAIDIFGLEDIAQEALKRGIVSVSELEGWRASLIEADANGEFFASLTGMIAAGCKPEDYEVFEVEL